MSERVIWQSPAGQLNTVVLVKVDVTDARVNARTPYKLVRRARGLPEHTLCELNRDQLRNLAHGITEELGS